jgi:hypothetical protein
MMTGFAVPAHQAVRGSPAQAPVICSGPRRFSRIQDIVIPSVAYSFSGTRSDCEPVEDRRLATSQRARNQHHTDHPARIGILLQVCWPSQESLPPVQPEWPEPWHRRHFIQQARSRRQSRQGAQRHASRQASDEGKHRSNNVLDRHLTIID